MSKSTFVRALFIFVLLLAFTSIAIPAGATPPEELNLTFTDVRYNIPSETFTGYGTWASSGVFEASGDLEERARHIGSDDIGCWLTVLTKTTLTDAVTQDTITLRAQLTEIDGTPGCYSFEGSGEWVIMNGTGVYQDLRGIGEFTATGYVDWPDYVINYEMSGIGHLH